MDGMSPPSNRTGFRRDTTTTAHRPGLRQSNGSRVRRLGRRPAMLSSRETPERAADRAEVEARNAHVIRAAEAPKSPTPTIGERRGGTTDFHLDADRFHLQRLDAFAYRFADLSCRCQRAHPVGGR